MKKLYYTMNCLLAAALLAGCSGSEWPEAGQPPHTAEANVPLGIEGVAVNAEVTVTRATTNVTTGSIGIFLSGSATAAGTQNGYAEITNRQYNYATPTWTPNGGAGNTIYLGGTDAYVCAYHPWTNGLNNRLAIPLTSQVYAAAKDISYAKNRTLNGASTACTTTFAMTRAYARIGFKFQRSNYPGTGTISKLVIKNLLPTANLNLTTGAYSTAAGTNAATLTVSKSVTLPASGTVNWADESYLLVPCTPYNTGMTIVLTVDGKEMTTTVPTATYKPVAGEYKTLTLTIKGTGLNVGTVSTTDWVTGTGNVDFDI